MLEARILGLACDYAGASAVKLRLPQQSMPSPVEPSKGGAGVPVYLPNQYATQPVNNVLVAERLKPNQIQDLADASAISRILLLVT